MRYRLIMALVWFFASDAFAGIEVISTVPASAMPREPVPIRLRVVDGGVPVQGALVTFLAVFDTTYGGMGSTDGSECMGGDMQAWCRKTTDADGIAEYHTLTSDYPGEYDLRFTATHPDGRSLGEATVRLVFQWPPGAMDKALTNMWWAGEAGNGWGMSLVRHGDKLFNVIFTYDDEGQPTWYVQPNGTWLPYGVGSVFMGPIYSPRSTPWFAYDSAFFRPGSSVGNLDIYVTGPDTVSVVTRVGARRAAGYLRIQDFSGEMPSPLHGVADMWWGGLGQNGWGVVILEQPGNLFSVWFTYGADGKPTWFVMPGGTWTAPDTYSGEMYRTSGSQWLDAVYDPSRLRIESSGRYSFRFEDDRTSFSYSIDGRSGTLVLRRQPFD